MAIAYFAELAAALLVERPDYRHELGDAVLLESFVHELRRYCPFTPLLGARPCRDLEWNDYVIPKGTLTVLDVYGIHHDERIWSRPHDFIPARFAGVDAFKIPVVQQGGGDHPSGHRCAGEWMTVETLKLVVAGLSSLTWRNDAASLSYDLGRIPARLQNPVVLELL
jgi:fatty-acid peroxygenase